MQSNKFFRVNTINNKSQFSKMVVRTIIICVADGFVGVDAGFSGKSACWFSWLCHSKTAFEG